MSYRRYRSGTRRMGMGAVLVIIGLVFLMANLGWFKVGDVLGLWPAALVAFGVVKLLEARSPNNRMMGGVFVVVGAFLLAVNLGYVQFSIHRHWPFLLMAIGVWMMMRNMLGGDRFARAPGSPSGVTGPLLDEVAIFGGGKRVVTTQEFCGGEITAVFGGFEIDLRKAGMAGDEAVIEANAVFGGVEIRIPETWSATVTGVGVFGGYEDKTVQPNVPSGMPVKRLILKGGAVFGGVEIKN